MIMNKNEKNKIIKKSTSLYNQGRIDESVSMLMEYLREYDNDDEIAHKIGKIYLDINRCDLALPYLKSAVEAQPNNGEYIVDFADSLRILRYYDDAISYFKKALKLNKEDLSALNGLGLVYIDQMNGKKALEVYDNALSIQKTNINIKTNTVVALYLSNQHGDAIEKGDKILNKNKPDYRLLNIMGMSYLSLGKNDAAAEYFRRSIKASMGPDQSAPVIQNLTQTQKYNDKNMKDIDMIKSYLNNSMSTESRSNLHFSLGKIYNDLQEWEEAFSNYKLANELVDAKLDVDDLNLFLKNTVKTFTSDYISKNKLNDLRSSLPVFVLGMPRSGTSLVEQIISSHSEVFGAGEISYLQDIIDNKNKNSVSEKYPLTLRGLNHNDLINMRDQYLAMIKSLDNEALKIVNKMPANFIHIGIIATLFPEASIIHVTRNPLDTCVSCYFQRFKAAMSWSFNFNDMGRYYKFYRHIMSYWEKLLPSKILTVSYEQLIDNPTEQSKRIIEYCGLEWEPACQEYYKTKRSVMTASHSQVRQPIYKTSRSRWIRYAAHLQPLVSEIGEYLFDYQDTLKQHNLKIPYYKRMGLFK